MSDYYLVDKTLLDNGLKEVANAIRQSGGTTTLTEFITTTKGWSLANG